MSAEVAISTQNLKSILIIQLRRLGDVLMITPAIRALRLAYPNARIDVLTERPSQQLLENNPYITEIISVPAKRTLRENFALTLRLRKKHYDLAIDFNGLPSSAILSKISGSKHTLGINHRGRGLLYSLRIPFPASKYSAQNKIDMLSSLGISTSQCGLDFFVSQQDKQWAKQTLSALGVQDTDFLVTLSPVSRQPYKVWPAQNFAAVADYLVKKFGARILFVFGPGEECFVNDVKKHMHTNALSTDYPMPSLGQTKALFEHAKLHIGNDNGPAHFAIAAGIAVITIFGEPKSENWTPPNNPKVCALEHNPGCKNNCTYPNCKLECLTGTSAEAVCLTAENLIAQEHLVS